MFSECKVAIKEFAKKPTKRKRPARLTFYDSKGTSPSGGMVSTAAGATTNGPRGSGISTKAFEFTDLLLTRALERVSACKCLEGCLECCCSERCREANQVMSKAGSEVVLRCLLGLEVDIDSLPWGPEDERVAAGIETVIAASEVRGPRGRRIEVVDVKREGGRTVREVVDVENGEDDEIAVKEESDD